MSPALADLPLRKVVDALESIGFDTARTTGSHMVLRHADGRVVIVPSHRTVKRGTLGSILRQAGLTPTEFLALLR